MINEWLNDLLFLVDVIGLYCCRLSQQF